MLNIRLLACAACLVGLSAGTARADVELTMRDGRVTLTANNVSVREILQAWARVGGTTIVNAERVTGGPVSLQLDDVPEADALAVILRSVSGYIAAPRRESAAHLSQFDRIHVLPTSSAPKATPAAPPGTFSPPPFPQPQFPGQFNPFNQGDDPADGTVAPDVPIDPNNPTQVPPFGTPGRGPVFGSFPPPVQVPPQAPAPAANTPSVYQPGGVPAGVAVPGMVVPVPQPPGGSTVPGGVVQTPPTPQRR